MRRANEAIESENFPLPTFDNLISKLQGARYFSRLDLASAYHQLDKGRSKKLSGPRHVLGKIYAEFGKSHGTTPTTY